MKDCGYLEEAREKYPGKFAPADLIFSRIHRGDSIFISSGCGEPQHLVCELVEYVKRHPKAFFDTEILHFWPLGTAPYADACYKHNFRHNSLFVACPTRSAVNECLADYTPVFLSQVPELLYRKLMRVDAALIQTSPPDANGYMSFGVSVDIARAAIENSSLVIAQVNAMMPRVHGDSFINVEKVDFIIPHDEPILEYQSTLSDEIAQRIGKYVARIVENGDTLQVGPGSLPNAVLANLCGKKRLGVHTDLLTDGIVSLMKAGVVDNSRKKIDRGKTVAAFCMGRKSTYEFINDNPAVEFKPIEYTNNPMIIAQHDSMTAVNSAFEIDLTGQATASSLGGVLYRGIGGQADFMRGAMMARNGKSILAMESTAENGTISRIVPRISQGAAVTFIRGDVQYVATEYGIAYIHGKNMRECAMELISIAHPKFRTWLIEEAKKLNLIFKDQRFITGASEEYPEEYEAYRTTKTGLELLIRPVKISDEPVLKEFFYSLSDETLYSRFVSGRQDMPHERLQEFVIIDYARTMVLLAFLKSSERDSDELVGVGQYGVNSGTHTAEAAFMVKDPMQNKGIGTELLRHLTFLAKKKGLLGFTAEVLEKNLPMLKVFNKMGFDIESTNEEGSYAMRMTFRD